MILSNTKILEALDDGRLVIEPAPSPRRPEDDPEKDCPFQTTSVDLRLGNEITWFRDTALNIDLRRGKFKALHAQNSEKRTIHDDQPYMLEPFKMVLGKTLEVVKLPIQSEGRVSLAARVEGRSSLARSGLLVHFTAPTIHANFDGTITLELVNLGRLPIGLYPGMYICQLILEEVSGVPYKNDSQFQGQAAPGG
jgi:dCTP deaminase